MLSNHVHPSPARLHDEPLYTWQQVSDRLCFTLYGMSQVYSKFSPIAGEKTHVAFQLLSTIISQDILVERARQRVETAWVTSDPDASTDRRIDTFRLECPGKPKSASSSPSEDSNPYLETKTHVFFTAYRHLLTS